MAPLAAFVPHLPLRASRFTTAATTMRRSPSSSSNRAGPSSSRRTPPPRMSAGGVPDFEEVARQLQRELQTRRAAEGEGEPAADPPMPSPDAPPDQQPIEVTMGNNNMPKVILRHAPSQQAVEIYVYGAAVTSWTSRGEDHFWVSDTNKWIEGGKPIRGGIPICFPQFGPYGDLPQHGFARNSNWKIGATFVAEDTSVTAVFLLTSESDSEAVAAWPYKFSAEYMVTVSAAGLETKLSVTNTDDKPIEFTCAFHNYFKTTHVKDARIFGYEGLKCKNRLDGDKEMEEQEDTGAGLLLSQETDRIYMNAPDELAMFDFASLKVLKIKKTSTLSDATLWNPYGAEGADPGWANFVCIEPACITNPSKIAPGETWVGAQLLGVE